MLGIGILIKIISLKIKKDKYEGMLCLLAIELNRKRKSKDLISNIEKLELSLV